MKKLHQEVLSFVYGGVIGVILLLAGLWKMSQGRALPGVMIAGVEVGGLKTEEIEIRINEIVSNYSPSLIFGEAVMPVPREVVEYQVAETASEAVLIGRSGVLSWWRVLSGHTEIEIKTKLVRPDWDNYLAELQGQIQIPVVPNELTLTKGEVEFVNGSDGIVLDEERLSDEILKITGRLIEQPLPLRVEEVRQSLTEEEIGELVGRAEKLKGDTLTIQIGDEYASLAEGELVSLLSTSPESLGEVSQEKIESYASGLIERYEREPENAVLQFVDGRVSEFVAARDGIVISAEPAIESLERGVNNLMEDEIVQTDIEIPTERVAPEISTEAVNDLGIVERIGRGESYYAHSIPNRVYNVGLASKRVSGALVPPGEEFSFNQQVGEISGATGYRSAYVISGGRTILGDGGGVCQVSTTVFRAALNAGLQITERWAHAYRVGYYEQNAKAGFDATIYSPSKDLKFLNDTPGHILVQTIIDEPNRHLIIDIYGTKDGRVSLISPARVWGVTPPPPDLYQDDPTLPKGTVQQVDWSAWGAKAAFDYRVEREGETIFSKTFNSNFQPWQNVYLRGTAE